MEKQKSIKINMVMNTILTASNFVFPLITYSYVARILLKEGTGQVAFVQSVLAYFSYIASLGIVGYGTRECAKVQDDREKLSVLSQELLTINLISTAIAYVALIIAIFLIPKFKTYSSLFLVMSLNMILQTIGMEWLYKALEKYTYITIRSIIFKIISVFLTFFLVKTKEDVVLYGFITIFTTSASNVFNFINIRKYIDFGRISFHNLRRHLSPIMVFFMSTVIISIYGHFDSIILGFMKGDGEVGIYNAALKMKTIVLSVSTAITSVLIPRMSVYFETGKLKQVQDLLRKSLRVSMLVLLPLSIFVMLNSENVLLFVCGSDFLEAKNTLVILMSCCIVLSITNIFGNQMLIPMGREKRYSQSVFYGMWINLILNTILIPRYASAGAAFATLSTEIFNMFWMGLGCKKEVKLMVDGIDFFLYIGALTVSLLVYTVGSCFFVFESLFVRLAINSILYFGVYYLVLKIMREPILENVSYTLKRKFHNR